MALLKLGFVIGGQSSEHEISLLSYRTVYESMHRGKYDIQLFGIDKKGIWRSLLPDFQGKTVPEDAEECSVEKLRVCDVLFPLLHGPFGEDGTVQGLFVCLNIPFVGAGILGSALGMDKDVMKRLLAQGGIPHAKFLVYTRDRLPKNFQEIAHILGAPFFVKPANLGSSIGISKIKEESAFHSAVEEACCYDEKILFEEAIIGRELNIGIIGNRDLKVSIPCEIISKKEVYDYEAKYFDPAAAERIYPAPLTGEEKATVEALACKTYRCLCCRGYARVDLFLDRRGRVLVNEINTIPGMTRCSPFPLMWEKTGLPFADLIDTLIALALEKLDSPDARYRLPLHTAR